jgi:asparagine N-glycosylation enzyme membrane subunit Stt3
MMDMEKFRIENFSKIAGKRLGMYALALGLGYLAAAIAQAAGGSQIYSGGFFGIAVLLVISATYLMGVRSLLAGRLEGLSFIMGGLLLSGLIGGLYFLMAGADALMHLLGEAEVFQSSFKISAATILLILSLPLMSMLKKQVKGMAW